MLKSKNGGFLPFKISNSKNYVSRFYNYVVIILNKA